METQKRLNQKGMKNQNDEFEVKLYPKNKSKTEKPKADIECIQGKNCNCTQIDERFFFAKWGNFFDKQKNQRKKIT